MKIILKWIIWLGLALVSESLSPRFHTLSMLTFSASTLRNETYFGYSVAYQSGSKRLLVGAPKADENGKIYQCLMDKESCTPIDITIKALRDYETNHYDHELLLGVSIASGSNYSVACAPRYTKTISNKVNVYYGTYGQCYSIYDDSTEGVDMRTVSSQIVLYKYKHSGFGEKIMDAFGWSVYVTNLDEIYVGSPAMTVGRCLYYPNPSKEPILMIKESLDKNIDFKNNYGYSIVKGKFSNNGPALAISAPFGSNGKGMIILLEQDKQIHVKQVIQDTKVGSIFGATICKIDLNGDSVDEIIVGAPAFQTTLTDSDNGAIFIYKNQEVNDYKFELFNTIYSSAGGGYFGSAIVKIGDINNDGVQDIAVGAPLIDGGRGAVFIISGSNLSVPGPLEGYVQKIQPEGCKGLGFSIASLDDYDENGCDEIAIGAPHSMSVVVLRCIATIELKVSETHPPIQTLPKDAISFTMTSCFEVKFPPKPKEVTASIRLKTNIYHNDAKIKNPNDKNAYTFKKVLNENTTYCEDIDISLPLGGDYSEAIQYAISAELLDNPNDRKEFDPTRVLLSENSELLLEGVIPAARGCDKGICTPNLTLTIIAPKGEIVANNTEIVDMTVNSMGDTAYASCVRVSIAGVYVSKFPNACQKKVDLTFICSPSTPLYKNSEWKLGQFNLDMKDLTNVNKFVNITTKLLNYCARTTEYKTQEVIVTLKTDSKNINITSSSNHEDVIVFKKTSVWKRLTHVEHTYTIINTGLTNWKNVKATFILEPKEHLSIINYTVMINSQHVLAEVNNGDATFKLPLLKRMSKIDIHIPFEIETETLEDVLSTRNVTLKSILRVMFDDDIKSASVKNEVYLQRGSEVPYWIILIAAIIGVLLLLLIGFILYEVGFFGRKNKEKLEMLKKRRSLMVAARQSLRNTVVVSATDDIVNAKLCEDSENIVNVQASDTVTEKKGHGVKDKKA